MKLIQALMKSIMQ